MARRDHINPYTRKDYSAGFRLEPSQMAWVTCHSAQVIAHIKPADDHFPDPQIAIQAPPKLNGGKGFHFSLTQFTEAELLAVRKLFNQCFDLALPLVQDRDRRAKEMLDRGDDSDSRVYRTLPTVVERPGFVELDPESVLDRLAYVPPVEEPAGSAAGGTGDTGSDVAERDET